MNTTSNQPKFRSQKGFTIIELMIAISVLSVLLLMGSVILIQIGKLYSKGVNSARIQNTARTLVSDVGSTLQFSGKAPFSCIPESAPFGDTVTCAAKKVIFSSKPTYSYCIGTTRYSYIINSQLSNSPGPGQSRHVLWQDTMTSDATCNPVNLIVSGTPQDSQTVAGSGKELIPENMRLTRFYIDKVAGSANNYGIDTWLAYGDTDLLNIVTSGSCPPGNGGADGCAGYVSCKGGVGQEFCATSKLSTTITRRLE